MEKWVAVESEEFGGGECHPDAVTKYAYVNGRKPPESLVLLVRKHLLSLGWKIERTNFRDYTHIFRYRYISPDSSKKYFSLNLLCRDLRNSIIPQSTSILPALASKMDRDDDDKDDDDDEWQENQDSPKPRRGGRRKVKKFELPVVQKSVNKRRNRRGILSMLLEKDVVLVGDKVRYFGGKNPDHSNGKITRDGIACDYCHKICSLSEFEAHAGSNRHRPSEYITLEDNRTLLDCKRKLDYQSQKRIKIKPKRRRKEKDGYIKDHNDSDYICSVCRDGGDLILCDKCPSAFHKSCICLEDVDVPDGDWFCPLCCCRICGHNKCHCQDDVQESSNIPTCTQCQQKFHFGCARGSSSLDDNWFCSNKCENIFLGLRELSGKQISVGEDNLTWTLLKSGSSDDDKRLDCAIELIHESFEPVEEVYTGRDIVEDVIFGRECKLNRLNFRGFYTAVLEMDDELISVANVRVLGQKVAEIPLVATRFQYRRLGMCSMLMNELEKQLMKLGVERLVLPSATVTVNTWVNGFGFSVMTDSDRREYLGYTFLDFQGTVMCQKFLRKTSPPRAKSSGC